VRLGASCQAEGSGREEAAEKLMSDSFSYVSVLTSIVLALGIARVFAGARRVLQLHGRVRVWIHLLWSLNVFLYLVLNW
jgi:hypothetical protein